MADQPPSQSNCATAGEHEIRAEDHPCSNDNSDDGENDTSETCDDEKVNSADFIDLGEWSDVTYTSISQSDVLMLGTPSNFAHLFSLLYAMERKNELTSRALRLTSEAIKLNACNPTSWMYRRRIVEALATEQKSIWDSELPFTAFILKESGKSYQAWEHRRFCVEKTASFQLEPDFINAMLEMDAKNYHAWAHRAWVVRKGITEGELDTCEWYIRSDVRNNSAWNHRWLIGKTLGREGEVNFSCKMATKAPRNESVWNYLLALYRSGYDVSQAQNYAHNCLSVDAACAPARRFLVLTGKERDAPAVVEHCRLLAEGVDVIRKKYWLMQKDIAATVIVDDKTT